MGTTCAHLTTDLGYLIGQTIGTTSRLTTTACERLLNNGLEKLVLQLFDHRCWKVLHELHKEATYTLTGATSYDVYTVIGSSTDYYGFVSARLGNYPLEEVTIEEEHRIQAGGEYDPTTANPYICFFGYDTTTGHGNLPKILIRPYSSTGTLYFRYLRRPPTIKSAATAVDSPLPGECDDAILYYAGMMYWSGERNISEWRRYKEMYSEQTEALVRKYGEPVFYDVRQPVR